MAEDALPAVVGLTLSLNCGFDRVRFPAPAKAGARVRGVFALAEATRRPEREWLTRCETTVEIEGADKPALVTLGRRCSRRERVRQAETWMWSGGRLARRRACIASNAASSRRV